MNQVHVGSIPIGRLAFCILNALESTWRWNLIVDQVAASSILVRSAVGKSSGRDQPSVGAREPILKTGGGAFCL